MKTFYLAKNWLVPSLYNLWPAPDGSLWAVTAQDVRQFSAAGQLIGRWFQQGRFDLQPVYDPAGRPWLLSTSAAYRAGPHG